MPFARSELSYTHLASDAAREHDNFARLLAGVPYERKGILYSEMFFLWLCAREFKPARILESGRARGQSTLILSRVFPESEIISIEYDAKSADVPVAAERLKDCANVKLMFGDATRLLPEMLAKDDIALIDGPKGFRGLRLAVQLAGSGKAPLVFVHDTVSGSADRDFLEHHLPDTLYSDNMQLAAVTHKLDTLNVCDIPEALRFVSGGKHYGYSLACIRHTPTFPTRRLLFAATWAGLTARLQKKG